MTSGAGHLRPYLEDDYSCHVVKPSAAVVMVTACGDGGHLLAAPAVNGVAIAMH